jgi:hypothetical protein
LILGLLAVAAAYYIYTRPPQTQAPPPYAEFDKLQEELASRARAVVGESDNFKVYVTNFGYDIGTLVPVREEGSWSISDDECVPDRAPRPVPAPSLFPSYSLTRDVAGTFALGQGVMQGLASAGIDVNAADTVQVSFSNVEGQFLSERALQRLISNPACREAIASKPMLLVRGYIRAQRNFMMDTKRALGGKIETAKLGAFTVRPSGSTSVQLTEDKPYPFLQILSKVGLSEEGAPRLTVERPSAPKEDPSLAGSGSVYVQQDRADRSGLAPNVRAALDPFNLVPQIEQIDSAKMPWNAQVRYFNAQDKPTAERALQRLRTVYPNAQLVQIGLPAPKGQLEVWMPRAAGSPLSEPPRR